MTIGGTVGTATMRAFAIDEFGKPGSVRDLPVPEPGEGEVLVRVKAAGVNATDLAVMAGWMTEYFQHNFPLVPGIDASGVVAKVGPGVEGYSEGDEVFGYARGPAFGRGTFAPFTVLDVGAMQRKPPSLTHEQAAVISHGSLTATAAVAAAELGEGKRVVILGATGGVGSYATQLAAAAGASVIAVTLGEHADYARGIGATDVIDYTMTDPAEAIRKSDPDGIDALIDLVGLPELSASMAALVHSGGRVVSIVMPPDVAGLAERGVTGVLTSRWATEDQFPDVVSKIADGRLKLPPIQTFAYDDLTTALGLQATKHVRGKLAIVVGGE